MQLHEVLRDRQADPEAPGAARGRRIGLAEAVEDERQKLRGDALPGVLHLDPDAALLPAHAHFHAS